MLGETPEYPVDTCITEKYPTREGVFVERGWVVDVRKTEPSLQCRD